MASILPGVDPPRAFPTRIVALCAILYLVLVSKLMHVFGTATRPGKTIHQFILITGLGSGLGYCFFCSPVLTAGDFAFHAQELRTRLTVGYAVRLLDMNDDKRLDIVVVDSKRILWLENPDWREHILIEDLSKKHDNVCFAPSDIDGDGQLDFAVGADWQFRNTQSGGTIGWIRRGATPEARWIYYPIGEEPTVHRMQFADLDRDGRSELIVVPLKGRGTTPPAFRENGVKILVYQVPKDPIRERWVSQVIHQDLHVTHNFWHVDLNRDQRLDLLLVSFEGVTLLERGTDGQWQPTLIGEGDQTSSPSRGASEIKHGRLGSGRDYIATIEPWHGNKVVVYTRRDSPAPAQENRLWTRRVLDEELEWGHAVSCANLDEDEDEELVIGIRDNFSDSSPRGLRIYDPTNTEGSTWKRELIDPGGVAIEDLAVADLDGDSRPDIVAVGRQTHNIKIYWNSPEP